MKFIHTSDWHLGSSIHDIDRSAESQAFLTSLRARILECKADALLVSGDIFDSVNPPAWARTQYYGFLASLLGSTCRNIVITGGNHDSAALLDAPKDLLRALNIKVVGSVPRREEDLGDLVVEFHDASGAISAICCAVPFVRESDLRNMYGEDSVAGLRKLYAKVYEIADTLRAGRDIPLMAMGHLYAAGIDRARNADDGVREIIGNLGQIPADVFPRGFAYVALGHIHRACSVGGMKNIRYSGSPFVMGFDEAGQEHFTLLVSLEKTGLSIEKSSVPRTIEFRRITGNLERIKNGLAALRDSLANPDSPVTYVEVLLDDGEYCNLRESLRDLVKGAPFTVLQYHVDSVKFPRRMITGSDVSNIKDIDEMKVFRLLVERSAFAAGAATDAEVDAKYKEFLPLYKEILDQLNGEGQK